MNNGYFVTKIRQRDAPKIKIKKNISLLAHFPPEFIRRGVVRTCVPGNDTILLRSHRLLQTSVTQSPVITGQRHYSHQLLQTSVT